MVPDVVIPHYRGSSTHVYEVARHLAKRGHNVTVVARRLNRTQPRWERLDGFRVYRTFQGVFFEPPLSTYGEVHADQVGGGSSFIRSIYGLYLKSIRAFELGMEAAGALSGENIDIVLERETAFGAGGVLSALLGIPLVMEIIGPRMSQLSLRRASVVIVYPSLKLGLGLPEAKVKPASAAVNVRLFSPDKSAGEGVLVRNGLTGYKVVGYVGTFPEWHGVGDLIVAFREIHHSHPEARLLLVGPYFQSAKELVVSMGLQDCVRFTGPIPYEGVAAYINACDVMCAPYNPALSDVRAKEGIGAPLKILEYMACRKPIVTTTVSPIPEVVSDGSTGLLVPPGDTDALERAVIRLLDDEVLAESLGSAARDRVEKYYSWEAFAGELEGYLEEAIQKKGAITSRERVGDITA